MRRLPVLILALLATACSGGPEWVNPALPKTQWSTDLTACRRQADDDVGRTDYYEPDDRNTLPDHLMAREDTRRRFDSQVAACMQANGYRRAK